MSVFCLCLYSVCVCILSVSVYLFMYSSVYVCVFICVYLSSLSPGNLCVLDGVHALDTHALCSLRRLLQDGVVDLPSGERLDTHPAFRVIALGLPASKGGGGGAGVSVSDSRLRYITSDLGWTYHGLAEGSASEIFQLLEKHVSLQPEEEKRFVSSQQQQQRGISQLSEVLQHLSETAGEEFA
jgi:hypothetical protein